MSISILTGAGFSKPAGYPLAREINERFQNFQPEHISIHSDGSAWFNNGIIGPNDWMYKEDAEIFKKVLEIYSENELTSRDFHYEDFYDWIKDIQTGSKNNEQINVIAERDSKSVYDFMTCIDILMNQLIKNLLSKNLPVLCLPQTHIRFLNLINYLSKYIKVNIFSLNHDIFLESMHFEKEMSDGFSDQGSPFYGELYLPETHGEIDIPRFENVRLPVFQDQFDKPINIYKLHGSINHYLIRDVPDVTVKTIKGVGRNFIKKEVNRNGILEYEICGGIYNATFLSGTTYKITQYSSTRYLTKIFQHFKENLQNSNILIVIGYGFRDSEINGLIREHFSERENVKMYVIDINNPEIDLEHQFYSGGVSGFDHNLLREKLVENCSELQSAIEEERSRFDDIQI